VDDIDAAGPATEAGMEPGDVIVSVQGKATPDWKSLRGVLDSLHVDESAVFTIERNGTQRSVTINPQYRDSIRREVMDYVDVDRDFVDQLGIIGLDLNARIHHLLPPTRIPDGVVIAAKCDAIKYDTDELRADDILHQINGHDIHDSEELRSYLLH